MDNIRVCEHCGCNLVTNESRCPKCQNEHEAAPKAQTLLEDSNKNPIIVFVLCLLFGILGVHRFYLRKFGTGILMLLTLGGLGVWVLVDLIFLATNSFKDKQGHVVIVKENQTSFEKAMMVIGVIVAWVLIFVTSIIALAVYATSGLIVVIDNQLEAMRSGDLEKAYSYTSKDFQNSTSLSSFKEFVEKYPSLKQNDSHLFNERAVENNIGTVKGTLTAKDGAQTPIEYQLIKEGDGWKILSFQLSPTGAGIEIKSDANTDKSLQDNHSINRYQHKGNRYSIEFPKSWQFNESDKGTILFRGKSGTQAYYSTVNIQTILSKKSGGQFSTVDELMDSLKNQIVNAATGGKVLNQGDIDLPLNPKRFHGKYVIFTYHYKNMSFKQMQVVIFRDDEKAFYAWAYTSPEKQYDTYLPIAKSMFESWTID